MNKSERDDLARLARQRAKLAKADAAQREKILLAEVEDLMAAEFEAREAALIAPSLESDDARAFLEAMPTAEQLMPSLSLDDLGVRTWQPPEGAAAAALTPSTAADRRRRKVLRAIAANPAASDREIG